jgi:serine/threonine protein kinase
MNNIGKYKILGILGQGGMGIVYKGLDPDIERKVAIKTIRFETITAGPHREELLNRVMREAKAAGRLNHPNIVTIYDVVREGNLTYIVMQYVDGQNLQARIDSGQVFSLPQIVDLLAPISDALDYAHKNGIVHRDIKPGNILIDESGKPYLADFGVARIETSTITQAGTALGTLSYMSPEQVKGEAVDSRSDIFALGVILYELLSGKRPFGGDNLSSIVYKIVHEPPLRITEVNKNLKPGCETVIEKALAKNPTERYQSCQEMIVDLQKALQASESSLAEMSREAKIAVSHGRKKKGFVFAAAIVAFVVVAGGLYLALSPKSAKSIRAPVSGQEANHQEISPVTRSAGESSGVLSILSADDREVEENLKKLEESFSAKNYEQTAKLAEEVLKKAPTNQKAHDYLTRARAELLAVRIAPVLQSGIVNYNNGNYSQCVLAMEQVLRLDKENKEAQKYLFQADAAITKTEISQLIEQFRTAEETKDLLMIVSSFGSPSMVSQEQADYRILFNGYDDIKSVISNISVNFSGRWSATASFSHLVTAVYKKDGKRKVVFEKTTTWQMKRLGSAWKITDIGTD